MSFPARAGRWIAPSVIAACAGALAAGLFDAIAASTEGEVDGLAIAATTGFVALVAVPALFVVSLAWRAIWRAWRLPELLASLAENDAGSAPRLAGWVAVIWFTLASFAWTGFQATWLLDNWTTFKPLPVSFGMALFFVGAGVLALILCRPIALGIAAVARKIDARWRRDRAERPSLFTARTILAGTGVVSVALVVLLLLFARKRLGPIDFTLAYGPALGLVVLLLAHAGVRFAKTTRVKGIAGALLGAAIAGAIVSAIFVAKREPNIALEIWGDRPVAGLAIDKLFDLDTIRANISLAQFRPGVRSEAEHPDIILITIDTVRADHTPPYQGKAEMPGLRALGERGVVFEYAYAPGNVTRRSIPAMAIGVAANRVKGRVIGWALRVDPRHVMLAERMRAGGYDTAGFMCCEGFYGHDARTGLQRGLEHLEIEKSGLSLARRARVYIAEHDKDPKRRPLFVWMHILEPHSWTQMSGEPHTDEERKRFYDRALGQADAVLVELLGAFSNRQPEKAPIVIVTADHGEGLGDHGQPYHSTDLYNSQLRVPLVMTGPGIAPGRVTETVSLVDLVPTIMDLAGFIPPTGHSIDGRSLKQLVTGKREQDLAGGVAFAAMIPDRSNPDALAAVIKGKYKLVSNGTYYELYDVRADPDEQFNVHLRFPAVVNELKKLMDQRLAAARVPPFD